MEKKRLLSLDVLRGLTVFGMIVVNNAGGSQSYESLRHSAWNGRKQDITSCIKQKDCLQNADIHVTVTMLFLWLEKEYFFHLY